MCIVICSSSTLLRPLLRPPLRPRFRTTSHVPRSHFGIAFRSHNSISHLSLRLALALASLRTNNFPLPLIYNILIFQLFKVKIYYTKMTTEISQITNSIEITKFSPRNISPLGTSFSSSSTSSTSDLSNLQNDLLPDLWQTSSTSSTTSSYGKQLNPYNQPSYSQYHQQPSPPFTAPAYPYKSNFPQQNQTPYQNGYQQLPSYQPTFQTPQPQIQCQNVYHSAQAAQCTTQCNSAALWKPYLSPISSTEFALPLPHLNRQDFPALTEENLLYNMEVEPIREEELFKFEAHPKDPIRVERRNSEREEFLETSKPSSIIDNSKVNTQLYKTELCASFMKMGICPYGNKCQFAHGENELKIVDRSPKWRSKPCANWAKFGNCRYGSRCCFKHN